MSDSKPPSVSDEAEQSFFELCEFDTIHIDNHELKHNLGKWYMTLNNYKLKDNLLQIEITPPYAEMGLVVKEIASDPDFFGKKTARLSVQEDQLNPNTGGLLSYVSSQTQTFSINSETEYLLFDTPYLYPHNWYTVSNKNHLYTKISHSVNYLRYFIQAYKDTFQSGVPLIFVKDTRETRNHYELTLILKEYLTISYVKTDVDIATIYFHLLLETAKKTHVDSQHRAKYHQVKIRFPRDIKNSSNVKFKFTANMI